MDWATTRVKNNSYNIRYEQAKKATSWTAFFLYTMYIVNNDII